MFLEKNQEQLQIQQYHEQAYCGETRKIPLYYPVAVCMEDEPPDTKVQNAKGLTLVFRPSWGTKDDCVSLHIGNGVVGQEGPEGFLLMVSLMVASNKKYQESLEAEDLLQVSENDPGISTRTVLFVAESAQILEKILKIFPESSHRDLSGPIKRIGGFLFLDFFDQMHPSPHSDEEWMIDHLYYAIFYKDMTHNSKTKERAVEFAELLHRYFHKNPRLAKYSIYSENLILSELRFWVRMETERRRKEAFLPKQVVQIERKKEFARLARGGDLRATSIMHNSNPVYSAAGPYPYYNPADEIYGQPDNIYLKTVKPVI